ELGRGGGALMAYARPEDGPFPPPLRGRAREGGPHGDSLDRPRLAPGASRRPFPGLPPSPTLPPQGGGSTAEQAAHPDSSIRSKTRLRVPAASSARVFAFRPHPLE